MEVDKLNEIDDLRVVWKNEAYDFTKWLSNDENLTWLAERLGLGGLELIKTEDEIGNFLADIVAKEEGTNNIVLIENQLEVSDHKHLGQILTYAAGRNAKIVIWICKKFNEQHRKTIDWLNENSSEDLYFFGIELKLFKIGESKPAPFLDIVAKPNKWVKDIQKEELESNTPTQLRRLDFWTKFNEYITKRRSGLRTQKPSPDHWYDFRIGNSHAHVSVKTIYKEDVIRCELWIDSPLAKQVFDILFGDKETIEKEIGSELDWLRLDEGKVSRIILSTKADQENKEDWDRQFEWLITNAELFEKVFGPRLKRIPRDVNELKGLYVTEDKLKLTET